MAAVRGELAALPHGWRVLHGVQVSGEHIDHLLIGPAGVVSLTTKFHPRARVVTDGRRMQVNGVDVEHLRRARGCVRRLGGLLCVDSTDRVPVAGGVVFVGLAECRVTASVDGTLVTVAERLADTVHRMPHALTRPEANRLAERLLPYCGD